MGHIYIRYYRGNRPFPDIKSMLIKKSSFFTNFHFEFVSILVEWLVNVMPKYRWTFTFTILVYLLLFMGLQAHDFSAFSFLRAIKYNEASTRKESLHYCSKAVINGNHYMSNIVFTTILILLLIAAIIATWT